MAFPSTSVRDSFTRANENPLANGWLGPQYIGDAQFQLVSNQAKDASGTTSCSSYLNSLGSVSVPLEVFFTVSTADTGGSGFSRLDYCIQNPNTSNITSYRVSNGYGGSVDLLRLERHDVGGTTNFTSFGSSGFWASGSQVGVRLRADGVHEIYRNGTLITTYTDTTYTSGLIGMSASVNAIHDDFGGGAATSSVTVTAVPATATAAFGPNLAISPTIGAAPMLATVAMPAPTVTAAASVAPFYLFGHTGTDRIWNIEGWLISNTTGFTVQPTYNGTDRLWNIESFLQANPVNSVTFTLGNGTDRIWNIESYLLSATGSSG